MNLPEEAKRAPSAPVWNQSFPSPKALFVRGTFFIRCYPLVHSRGRSPIRNLGMRVAAVVPQLASGTATATDSNQKTKTTVVYWSQHLHCKVFLSQIFSKSRFGVNNIQFIFLTPKCHWLISCPGILQHRAITRTAMQSRQAVQLRLHTGFLGGHALFIVPVSSVIPMLAGTRGPGALKPGSSGLSQI